MSLCPNHAEGTARRGLLTVHLPLLPSSGELHVLLQSKASLVSPVAKDPLQLTACSISCLLLSFTSLLQTAAKDENLWHSKPAPASDLGGEELGLWRDFFPFLQRLSKDAVDAGMSRSRDLSVYLVPWVLGDSFMVEVGSRCAVTAAVSQA